MRFKFLPSDEEFRAEVRDFVKKALPEHLKFPRFSRPGRAVSLEWHRILHSKGWSAWHWPREYGGPGWTPMQRHIFETEIYAAGAPTLIVQSVTLAGPLIYKFGTQAQKDRYLPKILSGEEVWCQGFSEPEAGSDLTHLKTRASREGEDFVLNGTKIWTSGAHYADMGFLLVRTDPSEPGSRGLSLIVLDMKTPGISWRPIVSLDGLHHLNQVFLDNVRVPKENLIGEENRGWEYARSLLVDERAGSAFLYWSRDKLARARGIAARELSGGMPLLQDPEFRRRLARAELLLIALEWSVLRVLANEPTRYDEMAVASVLKVRGSQLQHMVTELMLDALGPRAVRAFFRDGPGNDETYEWPSYVPGATGTYLMSRAATIFGGSLQIQKSLIAKLAFGL